MVKEERKHNELYPKKLFLRESEREQPDKNNPAALIIF